MAYGQKTGGRVKGTPNKKTAEILDILAGLKCDPIAGMVHIAENLDLEISVRLNAYKELAQYAYPKRKAIEYTGNIEIISHEEALAELLED